MHTLPPAMTLLLRPFAPLFSRRVWVHVQVLLAGAILAPAQRTVTAALRVMGRAHTPHLQRPHRVLNRDRWSPLAISRVLLGLLVTTFVPSGPLVIGVDETIERRRGAKIAAKGTRCGAFQPLALRQGKRITLGVFDVARANPVGRARLGLALSHRACAFRTGKCGGRSAAQNAHGLGATTLARGGAVVSPARHRGSGG